MYNAKNLSGEGREESMRTSLFLVRHAETEWNKSNRYQGHLDIELSQKGKEQAKQLALHLAHARFDAIYASDLARASDTARAIAEVQRLNVFYSPELREINVGAWAGLTREEIVARDPEAFKRWLSDSTDVPFPGGESYTMVQARVMPFIHKIIQAHQGSRILVVSHSGPLKVIILSLLGLSLDLRKIIYLGNASISMISITDGNPRLELLNANGCKELIASER